MRHESNRDASSAMSRRRFAGLAGAGAASAATAAWSPANAANEEQFRALRREALPARPNILAIVADDLGWADLSCYGHPTFRTPNIDRLAASGVRFTDAYAASSVCSPTRFGFYTGRYPGRLPGGIEEPIVLPNENHGIPIGHPTLGSLLKEQGYATALMGKWHCGHLPWFSPTRLGWDEFFGNFGGGFDYFSKIDADGSYDLYEGEESYEDLRYYTTILAERATEFVHSNQSSPWLLNLNFTTPHWPWEGPGDQAISDELTARLRAGEDWLSVMLHRDGGSLETYREMVESLDDAVGAVLDALRRSGQLQNTLVLFFSDNGGERFSYQWPFSGAKGALLEGGVRVSTLLSWPTQLRPRQVSHEPVITMDWTATLLELAGATPDPDYPLDGISLVSHLFGGEPLPERDLFWRIRTRFTADVVNRALRRGNLKYVRPDDGRDYLYDLTTDALEQANLAAKRPNDLAAMRESWESIDTTLLPYPD